MRGFVCLLGVGIICSFLCVSVPAAQQKETKSALERNPAGWLDLTADGLKNWKRVSIPPKSKLKKKSPWEFDAKTKTIICHGKGYHEMLLYKKKLSDGIFHVEWRFKKVPGKRGYNSGVYVRNSADGAIWHQAQVGSKNVGFIFGDTLVNSKRKRIRTQKIGLQRGKEAGEWNTYELTCKGKTVTLWINGAVTTMWKDCLVPAGYLGMEAEGWEIEFKNVKWKALD